MILPRFGMRKKTRSIVSGLLIAVTSLIALAYAYEEARANMLFFFFGTVLLLLLVMGMAVLMVTAWTLLRKLLQKTGLPGSRQDEDDSST